MNFSFNQIILLLTALTSALMAGLFFAWACSITVGLTRLKDREYIATMQAINRAIQNSWFFTAFFGAAILLPLSTYLHFYQLSLSHFYGLLMASILYWLGVMGITIFGNVPMNEALDRFKLDNADSLEISKQRKDFETRWNFLNLIRAIASILSLIVVLYVCLLNNHIK